MLNIKKGYSLTVLVITIAVILIITTTAVVSIKNIGRDKEISKFMNDLAEVKQFVVEYFAKNDALPVIFEGGEMKSAKQELIQILTSGDLLSQIDEDDVGEYYYVDITQLGKIHLDNVNRGYVVNEGTLNIYVTTPCVYKDAKYYTLTPYLLGEQLDENEVTPFKINVIGNPITWVDKAEILVSIPDVKIGETDGWNFKWLKGAKSATEFKEYEGAGGPVNYFEYGDLITFTENDVYTIYVENPERMAAVRKVVVTKIDDIPPTIRYESGEIILDDAQTGISDIRCKITENNNFDIPDEFKEENKDYYVSSAEVYPDSQVELLNKYLWSGDQNKGETAEEYLEKYEVFYQEYSRFNSVLLNIEATSGERENAKRAISELNDNYPQFAYDGRRYSDAERNIALYVEDMAGNATVYTAINRSELVAMQYILKKNNSLSGSKVVVNNNDYYTSVRDVRLYLQAMYAKYIYITEVRDSSPVWKEYRENLDYMLSSGDGEKILYAAFKDSAGRTQVVYDKIFLDTTKPTDDAPTVTVTEDTISIFVNQTDTDVQDGVETQSGITNVSYGIKEGEAGAFLWYSKPSLIPRMVSGITYTVVTKAIDKAGNEQISEEVTISIEEEASGDEGNE